MDTSKVTRVEVIDHTDEEDIYGVRAYQKFSDAIQVELQLQDDDRTLKIFIKDK